MWMRYRDDVDHSDDIYKIQHFYFHNFVFFLVSRCALHTYLFHARRLFRQKQTNKKNKNKKEE